MSNAYDAAEQTGAGDAGPPDAGGGPPQGQGGGVLAALQRSQQGPQPSAPGPGNQADAMMKIQTALSMIEQALPGLDKSSRLYQLASRTLSGLSRHLPQGGTTDGVQMTQLGDLGRGIARNALLKMILSQHQGGRGGEVSGAPQPPQPSTPLPGA